MDEVWWLKDFEDGNLKIAYEDKSAAMSHAAGIVGNRAGADRGEMLFYGPGDGSTRILIRLVPREWIEGDGITIVSEKENEMNQSDRRDGECPGSGARLIPTRQTGPGGEHEGECPECLGLFGAGSAGTIAPKHGRTRRLCS